MTIAVCTLLAWACLLEFRLWRMSRETRNARRLAAFAVEPCPKGGSHRWGPTSASDRGCTWCTACARAVWSDD